MQDFYEYINLSLPVSPLFFFIIAVSFRLLDNSGFLLLKQEIHIQSSYVSGGLLREHLNTSVDESLRQKLKQVLLYRRLHRLFLILMVLSLPLSLWAVLQLF